MSSNKIEDVAVMQAALKQIKGSNGRPLWPGAIDGRNGTRDIDSLSAAIAGFESKINRRISGVIAPGGDSNALSGMSPNNYQDMHGVPGTDIVAGHVARRTPKPDGGVETLALPEEYKDDLGRIVSKLKDALNWLPTVRLGPTDAQGRCEVTVDLGARFLDAQGRVPSKSAPLPPAVAKVVAQALSQPGRFSPPSRLTYALTLKSREPLCFPAAKLAGGSAAWPLFTGNVGKAGGNAIHDVACLQAALANVQMPGTSSAFWTDGIDGKASSGLNDALTGFQTAAGLDDTGTLSPGDATVKALSALLPSEFKGLRGLRGLAAAMLDADTGRTDVQLDLLPESLRDIIAPIDRAARERHGVALVLREMPRQRHDRLHITVTLGAGTYLDVHGSAMSGFAAPPTASAALAALIAADRRLALDANAAPGHTVLTVTGKTDAGALIDIEYREPEGITIFPLPPVPDGQPDWDLSEGITADILIAAGIQASTAADIAAELGRSGTYRVTGGASGTRYVILHGFPAQRAVLTGTLYLATNSAVVTMGLGPKGVSLTSLTASSVAIVFVGAIEVHELLTGRQDVVEAIVDMGFGVTGVAVSVAVASVFGGAAMTLSVPAWAPVAAMAGTGFVAGILYNWAIDTLELKDEVESLIRFGLEQSASADVLSDANIAP